MITCKEMRENRAKLVLDAQALIPADGKITAEVRAKFDAIMVDADNMGAVITRLEGEERSALELRAKSMQLPSVGENNKEVSTPEKEKEAFRNYIKYGVRSENLHMEYRDVLSTTASGAGGGGAFVPQGFLPILTEAQLAWGGMLPKITQRKVSSGAPMKYATVNDTANGLTVVGEGSGPSETDPTTATGTISSDLLTTGAVRVSLAQLQDSYFDIEAFLKNDIGIRYARGLNALVTNGSTTTNVASLLTSATLGVTTASGVTTLAGWTGQTLPASAFEDLNTLFGSVDPAYLPNSTWVMNSAVRSALMGVQNSLGNPIFVPSVQGGALDTILGRPVVLNQAIAAAAAGKPIVVFGDLSTYMLTCAQELTIYRLNERYMDTLEVGFIGAARHGGALLDAGTRPVKTLVLHASS
jgi:HK97 family phage major capsid protein